MCALTLAATSERRQAERVRERVSRSQHTARLCVCVCLCVCLCVSSDRASQAEEKASVVLRALEIVSEDERRVFAYEGE